MNDKERLSQIVSTAKLYFNDNKTQSEIASMLGVSRQLVGNYIKEAHELGIVKVNIIDPKEQCVEKSKIDALCKLYNLNSIEVLQFTNNEDLNTKLIIQPLNKYIKSRNQVFTSIGIGWGDIILQAIEELEELNNHDKLSGTVVPIIGNAYICKRAYHTNELNRMIERKTGLIGRYLYAPAVCLDKNEKQKYLELEQTKEVYSKYKSLTDILIQVHDTIEPEINTIGWKDRRTMHSNKCIGFILGYFYDINGNILDNNLNNVIQIPLEDLKRTPNRVGIIGNNISLSAILGALRSGILTDICISEKMFNELLKISQIKL